MKNFQLLESFFKGCFWDEKTKGYSTVTDFARFLGWSTFLPNITAI